MKNVAPTKNNYVDNKKLYAALCEYQVKCKEAEKQYKISAKKYKLEVSKLKATYKRLMIQFQNGKNKMKPEPPVLPSAPQLIYPRVSEYIGKCILLIADGLSNYWKFVNYSWKEDMAADGMEVCIKRIRNFNVKKYKNPHAYFTKICYFAAVQGIKKEKKQGKTKSELIKNSGVLDNLGSAVQDGDDKEYINAYLKFLTDNLEQNVSDQDKQTAEKFKQTTRAYQKKMRLAAAKEAAEIQKELQDDIRREESLKEEAMLKSDDVDHFDFQPYDQDSNGDIIE